MPVAMRGSVLTPARTVAQKTKRATVVALLNFAARRSGGHRGLLATDDAASVRPRLFLCLRRTPPR
jgi:hypothetical protein